MEEEEDTKPLLNNSDSAFAAPRSRFLAGLRNKSSSKEQLTQVPSNLFLDFAKEVEEEENSEPDLIAAVFVVAFDTHSGK